MRSNKVPPVSPCMHHVYIQFSISLWTVFCFCEMLQESTGQNTKLGSSFDSAANNSLMIDWQQLPSLGCKSMSNMQPHAKVLLESHFYRSWYNSCWVAWGKLQMTFSHFWKASVCVCFIVSNQSPSLHCNYKLLQTNKSHVNLLFVPSSVCCYPPLTDPSKNSLYICMSHCYLFQYQNHMVFEALYTFFFSVSLIGTKFMAFFKEHAEPIKGAVPAVILGLTETLGAVWESDSPGQWVVGSTTVIRANELWVWPGHRGSLDLVFAARLAIQEESKALRENSFHHKPFRRGRFASLQAWVCSVVGIAAMEKKFSEKSWNSSRNFAVCARICSTACSPPAHFFILNLVLILVYVTFVKNLVFRVPVFGLNRSNFSPGLGVSVYQMLLFGPPTCPLGCEFVPCCCCMECVLGELFED